MMAQVSTSHGDRATHCVHQSAHRTEQRRLASAIVSNERNEFPRMDFK
jgi:hypothetical protein